MSRVAFISALLVSGMLAGNSALATTIAYDGKCLAADSQITRGTTKILNAVKLIKLRGCVVAGAGDCDDIESFKNWFQFGGPKPEITDTFVVLVLTNYGCFQYTDRLVPRKVNAPYAIGSGSESALSALMVGATAKEAVEAAAKIDLYTGGEVHVMVPDPTGKI